jgi:ESCRT-I complex subunit VPS37
MDVDDFIKIFKEQRIAYHKRVIWGEQWAAGKVTWPDN